MEAPSRVRTSHGRRAVGGGGLAELPRARMAAAVAAARGRRGEGEGGVGVGFSSDGAAGAGRRGCELAVGWESDGGEG